RGDFLFQTGFLPRLEWFCVLPRERIDARRLTLNGFFRTSRVLISDIDRADVIQGGRPDHGEGQGSLFETGGVDGVLFGILDGTRSVAGEPAAVEAFGILFSRAGDMPFPVPDFNPGMIASIV